MKTLLCCAALGAALAAQGTVPSATKMPRPPVTGEVGKAPTALPGKPAAGPAADSATRATRRDVATPAKSILQAALNALPRGAMPATPAIQAIGDGAFGAMGDNWKGCFDGSGITYVAAPSVNTLPSTPLRLTLQSATVDGTPLQLASAAPQQSGNRIVWDRGTLVEAVDVGSAGIEQSFVFRQLDTRGEIVLSIAASSDLIGEDRGDGVAFLGTAEVHYSEAVAIDAIGNRVHAETRFDNGTITIRVPANFVREAQLPLIVDPLISTTTVSSNSGYDTSNPDLAYDPSSQTWALVYDRIFSATDTDVFLLRLDANLQPIGSAVGIDLTTDVWEKPSVANLAAYGCFLVVAQVSTAGTSPTWISGRIVDNLGILSTAQFLIEKAGQPMNATGDKLAPDVGGDPSPMAPAYFTVVWERAFTAFDHDIHMKQVAADGAVRSAAPTVIANSLDNQRAPSISKSDGGGNFVDQRFAIVFQQTYLTGDEDIYGSLITWDGQIATVNSQNTFPIDTYSTNAIRPEVSSPTLAGSSRHFVTAYEDTGSHNGDIVASCFDVAGSVHSILNVSQAVGGLMQFWPQVTPSVDCDGARFAIAYRQTYSGSGPDYDTQLAYVALVANNLVLHDETSLGSSSQPEFNPSVASVYSGSGQHSRHFATVEENGSGAPYLLVAHHYEGYKNGGFASRATGCGNLTVTTLGIPAIGESIRFSANNAHPLTGFVLGTPLNSALPTCPGCIAGVNGQAVNANPVIVNLPANPAFVGLTLSAQGYTFAAGPCVGTVSLSDTVDFTVQ